MMNKNGFTLVEMLVVIAIIILVSVVAVPAITPFLKGQRLNKGARIVQASALAARTMAINSRKTRWLVFDSINYKLSIRDETGLTVLGKEEFLPDTIEFGTSTGSWTAEQVLCPLIQTALLTLQPWARIQLQFKTSRATQRISR